MATSSRMQGISFNVLCVSLLTAFIVFGVRAEYGAIAFYSIAIIQLVAIALSAWTLGVREIVLANDKGRQLAAAGGLLLASCALFSLLPGIGPPGMQTNADNQLRYLVLAMEIIVLGSGFVVLREILRERGENFFSTLGFGAVLLGIPVYLIWSILMLSFYRASGAAIGGDTPDWVIALSDFSDILLFWGGAMIYIASAMFAISLGRFKLLGSRTARIFAIVSTVALLLLVSRGLAFPNPAVAFSNWYTIPGWVVGIPAIPWIIPCLIGVVIIRRAGEPRNNEA